MRLARTYAMSPVNIAVANLKVGHNLYLENRDSFYTVARQADKWLVIKGDIRLVREFKDWWEVWDFLPKDVKIEE
jgi:hypothetical protein